MSILDKDGLYFLPLGGADKIGMNMYVYASQGKFIVVDCGYAFLNDDFPGMDLAFADPSFSFFPMFLNQSVKNNLTHLL